MDTISHLAASLHGSIANDVRKVQEIEQIEREHPGEAATELQDLREDLIQNEGRAETIVVKVNSERNRHTEEQIRMGNLEAVLFRVDDELTKLKSDHEETKRRLARTENHLHTGQIAYEFEKDLVTYIYPDGKKFGSRRIFTNMKEWLENKKHTPQGSRANEKWHAVMREFSWSHGHEVVFRKLLESRIKFAHPTVNLDVAESRIPDSFTDQEKKCIEDIISITKRVNELMTDVAEN